MTEKTTSAYCDATTQVLELAFQRLEKDGVDVTLLRALAADGQLSDPKRVSEALARMIEQIGGWYDGYYRGFPKP